MPMCLQVCIYMCLHNTANSDGSRVCVGSRGFSWRISGTQETKCKLSKTNHHSGPRRRQPQQRLWTVIEGPLLERVCSKHNTIPQKQPSLVFEIPFQRSNTVHFRALAFQFQTRWCIILLFLFISLFTLFCFSPISHCLAFSQKISQSCSLLSINYIHYKLNNRLFLPAASWKVKALNPQSLWPKRLQGSMVQTGICGTDGGIPFQRNNWL